MLSILSQETAAPAKHAEERREPSRQASPEATVLTDRADPDSVSEKPEEFEIVMGRRQIASVLFVATVVLAIISAVSYLAGKSISPKKAVSAPAPAIVEARPASPPEPIPLLEATLAQASAPPSGHAPKLPLQESSSDSPIIAEPAVGAVYLQMAAGEKGVAAIFVDGLRKHGFQSFVAPGPNEKTYRVLIGPLPTPASFEQAKQELERLGLTTFARKYEK